ncbi:uncharacterized protein LOC129958817 [Argiope bruennichi]|uniref:Uncharacterized protein n=1 Tax=Argiope bruennichi TaxID=94029 RepID=A0A8T0F8D2_ARGBR|nr:uncharacterized protein LOC129958817 [Argiope bruennichi]KAF8785253.1 hypothetical protein HNY73_010825 [Argiope bruennichi]
MKRLRLKVFLWSVLLISVFLKNVEPSSVTKRAAAKATKATVKPQVSATSTTVASARSTTSKSNSRNTPRPKNSKRTTTNAPSSTTPVIDTATKQNANRTSTTQKRKQSNRQPTTTTTLSPLEIMNRLYQMHGLASHGIAPSHAANTPSTATKKKDQGSSMDDIYRLHAMAIAQNTHTQKKGPSSSESSSSAKKPESSNTKQNSHTNYNSMEQIYQQHSSLPSSMHHIMAQHSVSSSHNSGSSSKPLKTSSSSSSVQETSGSSLSTLMQPLLKQLTPVGAGIGVVLAPLLLFNGFLQFFSNMSRFLNNFAQTILPVRRPLDNNPQNQNAYFQNLGPAHLKRQPRDWYLNPQNMAKIQELTELFFRALKESEVQ